MLYRMSFPSPERFEALDHLEGFSHGFTRRCPGIEVAVEKELAVKRLWPHYEAAIAELGFPRGALVTGEQVHGADIALVDGGTDRGRPLPGVDGLVCGGTGTLLGVFVADCCAVYLVDPVSGSFGLVHSGVRGTESEIVPRAIRMLESEFGARPETMRAQLSPCIRPPDYETDFAAEIRVQCEDCGVPRDSIFDSGVSTATHLGRYYSYRMEKGKTGRMLALLGRRL